MQKYVSLGLACAVFALIAFAGQRHAPAQDDSRSALAEVAESAESTPLPESVTTLFETYMDGDAEAREVRKMVGEARRDLGPLARDLDPDERKKIYATISYIARNTDELRPKWWHHTHSPGRTKFRADMWGKAFTADYAPSSMLGMQYIWIQNNRLHVIVTWRPQYVDNDEPLDGWLAEEWGLTKGDLAEVIVWHELGHNYISLHLNVKQTIYLYENHRGLATHIQEFFADLTALRHASGRAAQTTLMFRNRELHRYNRTDAHTRAAHGLGALLLAEFMANPDDWPSVHFPGEVPEEDVELETLKYVYENFDQFSVHEYVQLKQFIDRWVTRGKNGDRVLREKGRVRLTNGLEFRLLHRDDEDWQEKRDQWVANRLEKLIADGRADEEPKQFEGKPEGEERYWRGIVVPWD